MNKNIIIGIVVVIALIGGYAIYKNSNTEGITFSPAPSPVTTPSPVPTPTPVPSPTPVSPTAPIVKTFTVTGSNFAFNPSSISVKKGDTVKITFKNSGGMHDWRVDEYGAATKVISTGAEGTITFVANKTGS